MVDWDDKTPFVSTEMGQKMADDLELYSKPKNFFEVSALKDPKVLTY